MALSTDGLRQATPGYARRPARAYTGAADRAASASFLPSGIKTGWAGLGSARLRHGTANRLALPPGAPSLSAPDQSAAARLPSGQCGAVDRLPLHNPLGRSWRVLESPGVQGLRLQDPHTVSRDPHIQDPHLQDRHTQDPHLQDPHLRDPHIQDAEMLQRCESVSPSALLRGAWTLPELGVGPHANPRAALPCQACFACFACFARCCVTSHCTAGTTCKKDADKNSGGSPRLRRGRRSAFVGSLTPLA